VSARVQVPMRAPELPPGAASTPTKLARTVRVPAQALQKVPRPTSADRAEWARRLRRLRSLGVVLPLAVLALVLSSLPDPSAWELAVDRLWREPWRLLTAHLVHWSPEHLAWDLAAFVGLGIACEIGGRRRTAAALALAAPAIAVGVPLLTPGLATYRGLSGLDSALFALLAARCLRRPSPAARAAGAAALLALLGKVAWEVATGAPLLLGATEDIVVVPAAHLLGGLAGTVAGFLPARRSSMRGAPARPVLRSGKGATRYSTSLLAAGALTLGTAGCGTMTLPPRLSPAERAQIERVRFDADVGVTTEYPRHIRKDVVAILQDTGLFRKVADLDELSEPPDLVVTVTGRHGGKAIIPLLTIVTLGVLPTFFTDDVGYGLVIRSPIPKGRVPIDYHYTARAGLGFSSAVLNVLPGWHHPAPRPPRRLARRFALAIVAQEAEIRALLDDEPEGPVEDL